MVGHANQDYDPIELNSDVMPSRQNPDTAFDVDIDAYIQSDLGPAKFVKMADLLTIEGGDHAPA